MLNTGANSLPAKAIEEFKIIFNKENNTQIDDKEAIKLANKLINLMALTYHDNSRHPPL